MAESGTNAILICGIKNKGEDTLATHLPNASSPLCKSAMALQITFLSVL